MDILIQDALILTQNARREIIRGDILLEDGRISKVAKSIRAGAEEKMDAKGKLAFPGLVNAHTHIPMSLFRGYAEGMHLHDWLEKRIWPAEAKLKPKHIRAGSMLSILEMVRSGTTCFNEMYIAHMDEVCKAVLETGIRASVGHGLFDLVKKTDAKDELKNGTLLAEKWSGKSPLLKISMAPHAPYTCSDELIRLAKDYARKKGLSFHMHVSETRKEVFDSLQQNGKRPVEYLHSLGVLDSNTILAHGSWVTKRESTIVGKAGASISHNPVANLKLATGGICPLHEYMEAGANVALGTDGTASNNSHNMLETMKFAHLMQSHLYWDPLRVSIQNVWDSATINGAKALGFNAGSIAPGKEADIVLADLRSTNLAPLHDARNLLFSMHPGNITDVIVGGKPLLQEGEFTGLNEQKIISDAQEAAEDLVSS
ncbi:MAG: amidohydrolase [Candidatus Micrarchaeia archaeon]|jgi:5-methylthioadenosine/S-adenosylhomocysteine deaminase